MTRHGNLLFLQSSIVVTRFLDKFFTFEKRNKLLFFSLTQNFRNLG